MTKYLCCNIEIKQTNSRKIQLIAMPIKKNLDEISAIPIAYSSVTAYHTNKIEVGMKALISVLLIVTLGLLFTIRQAEAHGGAPIEEDICTTRLDHSLIHLSLYQPQVDPETEFCTGIPASGSAFLVIDLVDFELRAVPLSLKITEQKDGDEKTVLIELPPQAYPQGVIQLHPNFEKAGTYSATLSRNDGIEGHGSFSLIVGQGKAGIFESFPGFYLIFGLAVLAFIVSARRIIGLTPPN